MNTKRQNDNMGRDIEHSQAELLGRGNDEQIKEVLVWGGGEH